MQNNMSYYDLYANFVHHIDNNQDNASPNLYVKETVATLVEYAKLKNLEFIHWKLKGILISI